MPTVAVMPSSASAVAHQAGDGVHGVVVAGGSGDAVAENLGAAGAKDRDLDLGAAEVDAEFGVGS